MYDNIKRVECIFGFLLIERALSQSRAGGNIQPLPALHIIPYLTSSSDWTCTCGGAQSAMLDALSSKVLCALDVAIMKSRIAAAVVAVVAVVALAPSQSTALVTPPWNLQITTQGHTCVDASTDHAPFSENNTRWALYAMPDGPPPADGWQVLGRPVTRIYLHHPRGIKGPLTFLPRIE